MYRQGVEAGRGVDQVRLTRGMEGSIRLRRAIMLMNFTSLLLLEFQGRGREERKGGSIGPIELKYWGNVSQLIFIYF